MCSGVYAASAKTPAWPGSRTGTCTWGSGSQLWLFGGIGRDESGQFGMSILRVSRSAEFDPFFERIRYTRCGYNTDIRVAQRLMAL